MCALLFFSGDADKARKHGMEEFIAADPITFDHQQHFAYLQTLSLDWRLNDPFASLGWFTPGQMYILDEYCARYGVRGCYRHLKYLEDLLDRQGYPRKHIRCDKQKRVCFTLVQVRQERVDRPHPDPPQLLLLRGARPRKQVGSCARPSYFRFSPEKVPVQ